MVAREVSGQIYPRKLTNIRCHRPATGRAAAGTGWDGRAPVHRWLRELLVDSSTRMGHPYHWFASAAPGLEEVLRGELAALAASGLPGAASIATIAATAGGVAFTAPLTGGMAANLRLGTATRVLARAGEVGARALPELERKLAGLDFSPFLPPGAPVRVSVATSRCRLYHTGAIAERVRRALGLPPDARAHGAARDQAGRAGARAACADDAPEEEPHGAPGDGPRALDAPLLVLVRGARDRFTVSVDGSGALLHRRGFRPRGGGAPLRETLAAGLLRLSGWQPGEPLCDPMCGSGTLPVEAAAIALGLAPGRARRFAFERWPCFDAAAWAGVRAGARAAAASAHAVHIFASDRDARAVALAEAHAEAAGVRLAIDLAVRPLAALPAPAASGLLLTNPPYGQRLGSARAARAALAELGAALRGPFSRWRAAILTPDPRAEAHLALPAPPLAVHALDNGGLRVRLLCYAPAG